MYAGLLQLKVKFHIHVWYILGEGVRLGLARQTRRPETHCAASDDL